MIDSLICLQLIINKKINTVTCSSKKDKHWHCITKYIYRHTPERLQTTFMTKTLDFKSKKRQWIGNPIESKYVLCKICSWVKRKRKVRFWPSKFEACKCKEQSKRDCKIKLGKEEYYKIIREKSNGLGDPVWLFDYRSAFEKWVRLMCALRAYIKFSSFRNIFLEIEKVVITFSILEKIFSKNGN